MLAQRFEDLSFRAAIAAAVFNSASTFAGSTPSNDECTNAMVLTGDYWDYWWDNTSATSDGLCEPNPACGDPSFRSLWYRFDPQTDGEMYLYLEATAGPHLSIFNGCAIQSEQFGCLQPQELECIFYDDWGYCFIPLQVEAGQSYLIRAATMEPQGTSAGMFEFWFYPAPANDDCANATQINSSEFNQILNVELASTEPCDEYNSECLGMQTYTQVWYRYDAQVNGTAIIHTDGSTYDTALVVYDGCPIQSLGCFEPNEIACASDPNENGALMLMPMTAGETYLIKAADASILPTEGADTLHFNFGFIPAGAPINDICANATLIESNQFNPPTLPINLAGASMNDPQENCETLNGGVSNSVFYRFTPAESGLLDVNTTGSSYDTVLSIFDGCGWMTVDGFVQPQLVACNNDDPGSFAPTSRLTSAPLAAGATYIIKVSGNGPGQDTGDLDFNFTFTPDPIELCAADIAPAGGNGTVNVDDLLAVISAWGACGNPANCPADIAPGNGDGQVNVDDLLTVITAWGACP